MNNSHTTHDDFLIQAVCKFQIEAQHCADDAPPGISQEKFPHAHFFHITAWRRVKFSDREVWPQLLRIEMKNWFRDQFRETVSEQPDLGNSSCAALARWILQHFQLDMCEVLEDGLAGAMVTRVI